MPDVEAAAGSPKKRGRPPKEPPAASADSDEPVVKRGRGRPKGSKSAKKKETVPKPTGPKRPRGRPKGSVKTKPADDKSASPKKSPRKSSEWDIKLWTDILL